MGGGTSLWASPEWKSDAKEIFNWRLYYLTTSVAFAGCAYGFDQGNIGGVKTLPSFRGAFGLDTLSAADADERGVCIHLFYTRTCPKANKPLSIYVR
jgi:hypothetical protein